MRLHFVTPWPWPLTFWSNIKSVARTREDYPCGKLVIVVSAILVLSCGQTHTNTDRRRWMLYSRNSRRRKSKWDLLTFARLTNYCIIFVIFLSRPGPRAQPSRPRIQSSRPKLRITIRDSSRPEVDLTLASSWSCSLTSDVVSAPESRASHTATSMSRETTKSTHIKPLLCKIPFKSILKIQDTQDSIFKIAYSTTMRQMLTHKITIRNIWWASNGLFHCQDRSKVPTTTNCSVRVIRLEPNVYWWAFAK